MRRTIRRIGRRIADYVARHLPMPQPETLISKASRFVACELIEGDYLEFGVFQGASFIAAYHSLKHAFESRIAQDAGGTDEGRARNQRAALWKDMRFIAFDSFEGLPTLSSADSETEDFQQGQYACSEEDFREALRTSGVPLERTQVIKGWFAETCTADTRERMTLRKAAIVWIDCDLYSSARTALDFVTPLLQDGTVIVFDDWFSYKGNPRAGEQKAFREWVEAIADAYTVQEYQKETWKRCSFIVSRRATPSLVAGSAM